MSGGGSTTPNGALATSVDGLVAPIQTTVAQIEGDPIGEGLVEVGVPGAWAVTLSGIIRFVAAFLVIYAVGRIVVIPLVRRAFDRRSLDEHARKPLLLVTRIVVLFVAVAVAFGFAGFGNFLVSMAGVAAAATLAIGLAMQNVIANVVAGVYIYTDKPFRIGDWIEWDDGTYSGVVDDISLRVTRVWTFDNELLTVPNVVLTSGVIKNPVAGNRLRLTFDFGIGYDDDIRDASAIIVDEAARHPDILEQPAPSVRLTELGDADVGLRARFWIANPSRSDFVKIRSDVVTAVKERFDEEGIDIPYPIRTLEGGIEVGGSRDVVESGE